MRCRLKRSGQLGSASLQDTAFKYDYAPRSFDIDSLNLPLGWQMSTLAKFFLSYQLGSADPELCKREVYAAREDPNRKSYTDWSTFERRTALRNRNARYIDQLIKAN